MVARWLVRSRSDAVAQVRLAGVVPKHRTAGTLGRRAKLLWTLGNALMLLGAVLLPLKAVGSVRKPWNSSELRLYCPA